MLGKGNDHSSGSPSLRRDSCAVLATLLRSLQAERKPDSEDCTCQSHLAEISRRIQGAILLLFMGTLRLGHPRLIPVEPSRESAPSTRKRLPRHARYVLSGASNIWSDPGWTGGIGTGNQPLRTNRN